MWKNNNEEIIIGDDFNVVLDPHLDKKGDNNLQKKGVVIS
jgi:hypothetical protein